MADHASTTATRLGGRYRLVREIARGGMATVHRAVDEVLEREVAVKVLHGHLAADPVFLDRFLREARAAAALSHSNVVSVFDWGQDQHPDGDVDAFLVMELVDGPSLRDVLRSRGPLAPAEASAVLAPAADGIAAAHARGLVHRDVKPENILLSPDGTVKVTDFGLARAAAASTQTFGPGAIVGSPHYLAPEAVREERLDARADVYGLGVVLYECLVGRPPFESDTALGTAMRHTTELVPLPSEAAEITTDLDAVVERATEPEPDHRFEDAAAFAAALRSAVPPGELPWAPDPGGSGTVVIPGTDVETVVPDGGTDTGTDMGPSSPRRRRRLRWRRVLIPLTVIGVLLGGLYLAWSELIAPVTDIPDVASEHLPRDQAVALLREAGFDPVFADEQVLTTAVPAEHVVSQSPTGRARLGTTVTLKLSGGPPPVEGGVPDVVGAPVEEALDTLRAANLEPEVVEEHHEEVAEGTVIRTEPAAETAIEEGQTVRVVASLGPAPIEVPGVVGMSEAAAVEALRGAELDPEVVAREFSEDVPEGAVMAQDPGAGAILHRGDQVRLTISEGPAPFPMPDVRGRPRDDAERTLRGAGLEVVVREQDALFGFRGPPGTVGRQDPEPGTTVRRGDTVTIWVWK